MHVHSLSEWLSRVELQRVEIFFGAHLGEIQVIAGDNAVRLCRNLSAHAFAIENSIVVSQPNLPLPILVHEIAHIIQGRNFGGRQASAAEIEIEANNSMIEFLLNEPSSGIHLFRSAQEVAKFDEIGHFAFVFLAYCNAGATDELAGRRAFSAWFPDYFLELAATEVLSEPAFKELDYIKENAKQMLKLEQLASGVAFNAIMNRIRLSQPGPMTRASGRIVSAIQEGLHTLTGGRRESERTFRYQRVMDAIAKKRELDIGLALHAFGDVYAHARLDNIGFMYAAPKGHALDGKDPDKVWTERDLPIIYDYLFLLHEIARAETRKSTLRMPMARIYEALAPILPPFVEKKPGKLGKPEAATPVPDKLIDRASLAVPGAIGKGLKETQELEGRLHDRFLKGKLRTEEHGYALVKEFCRSELKAKMLGMSDIAPRSFMNYNYYVNPERPNAAQIAEWGKYVNATLKAGKSFRNVDYLQYCVWYGDANRRPR